jgi:hypothetical protein
VIAGVNLGIVVLMLRYDTRAVGALAGVLQVGGGAYAKWKGGLGVLPQVVLAALGVGIAVLREWDL